jgi:hypothetical protein
MPRSQKHKKTQWKTALESHQQWQQATINPEQHCIAFARDDTID